MSLTCRLLRLSLRYPIGGALYGLAAGFALAALPFVFACACCAKGRDWCIATYNRMKG